MDATPPIDTGTGDRLTQVRRLADTLDRVSRTVRGLLVLRAAMRMGAVLLGAGVLIALADLGLRLPGMLRGLLLACGAGFAVLAVRATVVPAWRARPGRASLALRLEAIDPARAGRIAPGVDLLDRVSDAGPEGALARAEVERAGREAASVDAWKIVRWSGVSGAFAAMAGAVALAAGLFALSPAMGRIGTARVLTPWRDVSWPTRYGVTDLTGVEVHPADESLPVRVAVGPGDPGPRVRLEWRVGDAPVTRTPMAPQPGRTDAGRPYERLIDPLGALGPDDEPGVLRYRVVTPDDRGPWVRVRLVRPPEVRSAGVTIEPPEHAAGAPGLANFRTGERELGAGGSSLGPVLEGSRITAVWRFSTEVEPDDAESWSAEPLERSRPDGRSLAVSLVAAGPARIEPRVRDAYGLGVREAVSLAIDVRADAPPGVAIAEPNADRVLTPAASLPVRAEAGDDIGLTALRLDAALLRRPEGSAGAAPEPVGGPETLAVMPDGPVAARGEAAGVLSPGAIGARPGDEIVLVAVATDTRGTAGEARSAERRLRIVSPEEFVTRLRAQLDPVSRLLRRADEQQGALMDRLRRAEEDPGPLAREQVALAETVASAEHAVRELAGARERNAVDDPALESLLRDLAGTLAGAADTARAAAGSIESGEAERAAGEQRAARDRIGEALSMLDRGEDAFLARRSVARIREQLAEGQRRTGEVGQRTAGRDDASLSPADRAALRALAEEQAELAAKAREAMEELLRRAESLEQDDPAQAEALRRAAEQGRAGAVGQLIEQAAAQTGSNRTGEARESQQEALDRLDEMLEAIDQAGAMRDTALRRRLATLVASITTLVQAQRGELAALDAARGAPGDAPDLAPGMIALRNNTLGVIEEASAALAELRLIAESLREAESAQGRAASALRAAPAQLDAAETHEQSSLAALTRALEEANRQEDAAARREQDRRKAELRKAYREALERQSALREESAPFIGRDLNRRERVETRRLGAAQRELADSLVALRDATSEIAEAPVFSLAHDRIDALMRSAADGLNEARPGPGVTIDQQQAAGVLASLVEVLGRPPNRSPEDFQDGSGGGDGQGGSGGQEEGLIPPIAELRLLRDMQRAAMDATRALHERPELADPARVAGLSDLQRLLAERGAALIQKLDQPPGPASGAPPGPEGNTPGPADQNDATREPSGSEER